MTLKVKIKEVREQENLVVLSVNGVDNAYLLNRSQPLSPYDAQMLRHTMDMKFLEAMVTTVQQPKPFIMVRRFFGGLFKRTSYVNIVRDDGTTLFLTDDKAHSFFGPKVVDFIRRYGIPLEVEGKQCMVLTPQDMERLERGDLK